MSKISRDPKSVELAQKIIDTYHPGSVEDMQNALKAIFAPLFEQILKGKLKRHLATNLTPTRKKVQTIDVMATEKIVRTSFGKVDIEVPREK